MLRVYCVVNLLVIYKGIPIWFMYSVVYSELFNIHSLLYEPLLGLEVMESYQQTRTNTALTVVTKKTTSYLVLRIHVRQSISGTRNIS